MKNSTTREPEVRPDPAAGAGVSLSHRRILTIMSGLLLGLFLAALDQNIVTVAIVRIANSLDGFDQQAWATTAYLITATISTPLYGKLADIYGRKPFYLIAIGLFVLGSAACTFATSMPQLAAFRAFQGLGAGGLMSLAMTIIGDIVPPRQQVRYQGYFMMVFGTSTVLGPVLGGFFSEYDHLWALEGWRWVFLVNVPIGVLALLVVAKVLNVPHQRQRYRVDWLGAVALAVCVVPILLIAEQGRAWGWQSDRALTCYGVGAAGLALFLIVEFLMKDAALIPLRLFRSSTFSITILGGFIVGIAMFGAISMVPLYLQVVREYSPTESGLMMLPLVVGIMVGSWIAGAITKATGRYKILPVLGTFVIAVGAALFAQVQFDSPLWQPLAFSGVIGLGLGGCMQTLIIAAQAAGPRSDMGVSTAAATFFRQMGGTLGVTVFLTVLFNLLPHRIVDAFGGTLPPGFDAAAMTELQNNTSGIAELPAGMKEPILVGFTESMGGVFYVGAGVSLLACLVLLFMKEIPLQDSWDTVVESGEAEPEQEPPPRQELSPWDESARELVEHEAALVGAGAPVTVSASSGESADTVGAPAASATAVLVSAESGDGVVHSLDGRIHRVDGQPVAEAALTLIDQRGHQVSRATGGLDGGYRMDAPSPGGYVLIVSATGYQPSAVNVIVGEWPQALDVTLLGTGEVSGVVRALGRGDPLSGVTVTLTDAHGEVVGSAITGADGRYVCDGVVPGDYILVAVSDRMRPAATTLTVPGSGRLHHDVELGATGGLAGLAWADGHAVPDAQVVALDAHGDPVASARTDVNGQYVLADLPQGEYTVVARGYPPSTSRAVVDGGERRHDVRLGYEEPTDLYGGDR